MAYHHDDKLLSLPGVRSQVGKTYLGITAFAILFLGKSKGFFKCAFFYVKTVEIQ